MQITPLVLLAATRVPLLTTAFSDEIELTSMVVTAGGSTVLTTVRPHGTPISTKVGVSILDAFAPNPIEQATLLENGDVRIRVTYPHLMSPSPETYQLEAWDAFARIAGYGHIDIDGTPQLVSVENDRLFTIRPDAPLTVLPNPAAGAKLLERLEREVVGWHSVTATGPLTLSFPTPATVTRSYTVTAPRAALNIRCWGAVSQDHALSHFVRENESDALVLDRGWMFVCPHPIARLSRDRAATSDATTEIEPGTHVRQTLVDGFDVVVVLPAERYGGAVGCVDRCRGEILRAMLRTFNGVVIPWGALDSPGKKVSMLNSHGMVRYDRANYVHVYGFEASAMLTDGDCASPVEIPDLRLIDDAVIAGIPITDAPPIGTVPFKALDLAGLYRKDHAAALDVNVVIRGDGP